VGIPQASDAKRTITARINSGELELVSGGPATDPGGGY